MERARGLEAESHQEQLKDLAYPWPETEKQRCEGRRGSRLPAFEGLSQKRSLGRLRGQDEGPGGGGSLQEISSK